MEEINLDLYTKVKEIENTLQYQKLFLVIFTKFLQELDTLESPDFWDFVSTHYFSLGETIKFQLHQIYDMWCLECDEYLNRGILDE